VHPRTPGDLLTRENEEEQMTTKATTKKRTGPTPEEVIAEQRRVAEQHKAQLPAKVEASRSVDLPDGRSAAQRYVDEQAPANIVGRMIRFGKDARFITSDDDEPIDETAEFVALCDEVLVGWIRFYNDGETPPDRVQGLLFDGFMPPPRSSLGDLDQSKWPEGLSGKPEDPWKHQNCLPLQHTATHELFTYVTTSATGRRSVANLLRHYGRMRNAGSNDGTHDVPVVRLRAGGFNHRDPRVGWVPVPQFVICGRTPRESAAMPDTSVAGDMNDAIPHLGR
jgi:hypothetical protein